LRVGFFIDRFRSGAGTENQILGVLEHLDRAAVSPRLYTLRGTLAPADAERIPCPVHALHVPRLASLAGARAFGGLVAHLRREPLDIAMVYFQDTNLFVVPAARLAGVPVRVVNRRDMGYWHTPGLLRALRVVNRSADYFLVNAEAIKQRVVASEGFPAERIQVVGNGLFRRDSGAAPLPSRKELGLPSEGALVGIVANLRPVKGVDRFVDMAARVARGRDDVHFVIMGQGREEPSLRARAADLGIDEIVHFLGNVPTVPAILSHCAVGVLTSHSEGLSNALIEYAEAGLPAVAFATGGNGEVIVEGETGFLAPQDDVAALADHVSTLLDDARLRTRMAAAARVRATTEYAPGTVVVRLMEFWHAALAGVRGSDPPPS
jgi:glycosyltransferase involved in cell wall biosynthesis